MGNPRSPLADKGQVVVADENAMRQHRAAAQEAEPVQRLGVGDAAAFQHMAVRPVAFRAMGLHMATGFFRQRAQPGQRLVGAGRNKARGDDGLDQPGLVAGQRVDVIDEGSGIGLGGFR